VIHVAQYLDVYSIGENTLTHKQRASVIPDSMSPWLHHSRSFSKPHMTKFYLLGVRGKYTYRSNAVRLSRDGKTIFSSTRGWNNTAANGWVAAFSISDGGNLTSTEALTYYKAPLTLGSAAGLRVAFWEDETNSDPKGVTDYMYLSDTEEGYMYILGWTPANNTLAQVAALHYPDNASPYEAVWLD
jgi:carboxy-cis,cis-muconate cyclase